MDGFFDGARCQAVADALEGHQAFELLAEVVHGLVALAQDQAVDVFQQHGFAAGGVLQVHGAVVAAVEAGVGNDRDRQFVQFAGQLVAHVERQVFAAVGAVDRQLHLVPGAYQALGDAGADPVAAPVGHHDAAAQLHFIPQHLPGVHHLQVAAAFEVRPVGLGAGGDDHVVGVFPLDQGAVDSGVAHHFHPGQLHFPLQVGAGAAEFAAPGQQLRQLDLATQLRAGFVEGDLVAALRGDGGGFHPGRAAAHHQDAFAASAGFGLAVEQFAAGFRVLDAGDRQALVEVADARLVAGDASAHVFGSAAVALVGHLRVADQRAGHAAHIGLALGDDRFGFLGLVDASGDEQRDRQLGLEGAGFPGQISRFHRHGGDDVHRAAEGGGGAGDDVHVVQLPLQQLHGGQGFVFGEAFGVAFIGGNPQADDELGIGAGAHGVEDFPDKAQALLQFAVVAVAAAVDPRVDELRRQVAVAGHQFHAVQPGLMQAPGGVGVALDLSLIHI